MHDRLEDGRAFRLFNVIDDVNRTVRYDGLAQNLFQSIQEVQEQATRWLWTYNNDRPNTAIGDVTPIQRLAMVA